MSALLDGVMDRFVADLAAMKSDALDAQPSAVALQMLQLAMLEEILVELRAIHGCDTHRAQDQR